MTRKKMKVLSRVVHPGEYNYAKARTRVARLGRGAKILEQVGLRGPHNLVMADSRTARQGLDDRKPVGAINLRDRDSHSQVSAHAGRAKNGRQPRGRLPCLVQ
ncbi:MAG: hypothetical protein NTX53_06955 [candidate division WOR-3 bacterium]|nr:hypothetical protein [candidate division WOR-3 bacterium]